MEKQFGLIPSPKDDRDYLLSGAMPELLRYAPVYPRPFDLTIFDQKSNPSCVGWSGAEIKQYLELKEKNFVLPDGEYLYNECKKIDGMPQSSGTFFRAVLKVLRDVGCKMQDQDNDPSIYRIAEYRKIDDMSFEGIKKSIFLYGHAIIGWYGSNGGWSKEPIRPPKSGEKVWGHATTVFSYDENYIYGQNHWGEEAHNKGIFKFDKDYLPFEGWVVTIDKVNMPGKKVSYGWVAKKYVDKENRTTANLRVREKPGLSYDIIKVLPKGTKVSFANGQDTTILEDAFADGYIWRSILV